MEQQEKLAVLRQLVGFKTIGGNELAAAEYIRDLLAEHGIKSEIHDLGHQQANLIAEIGTGQKPVFTVSGHLDTVAVDEADWDTNPFELVQKDGQFYGSGVTDMKGGVAALVIAMIELHDRQVPLNGTLRLVLTAGEESDMRGSRALHAEGVMQDVDTLLIAEPTGYRTVYANKGEVDFVVTSVGKAAHSSRPNFGINAIQNLMDFLEAVKTKIEQKAEQRPDSVLGKTTFTVDIFQGGIQINAIPAKAEAQINTRIVPEYNNEAVIADFNETLDEFNANHEGEIQVKLLMNIPPVVANPDSRLIREIVKIATPYMQSMQYSADEQQQGAEMLEKQGFNPFATDKLAVLSAAGGTDASELLRDKLEGANYAVFGPGNPLKMHQTNEAASEQMWFDFIEIYEKLFAEYLK
ncbi:ArgE/DapE family deacylase [Fructilactobacillus carniphilus]|uniref:ArgE/DapE family deacylase n=1 Tax=Fructilactobacillus carniphilus TaxID=2940297 RepID=A0ABY5BZ30_9LACO|nr:ArgE/DapE family deacylase [Fructilactobacillus carniphilus]USS91337.1 ArgE/DapE family deacylase [Fructilactobacillus carniphilus]